jgi:hypothetical protein
MTTAVLTLLGGVIVYVTGQIVSKLLIDPFLDYRKTVRELLTHLSITPMYPSYDLKVWK